MSLAELERALGIAGIEAPARWEETTGSTNAAALELAAAGAPEWTLVGTDHQTAGRGRQGRNWEDAGAGVGGSAPGPGALLISVVLRPRLDPADLGLLSLLAGTAMVAAAGEVAGVTLRCKWPNDLLLGEEKAGGILGEPVLAPDGSVSHLALGVGANLLPPAGVPGAAGIGADVDRAELLGTFLRRFRDRYEEADPDRIVREWTEVSATLGREVIADRTDGSLVQGTATGLDPHGGLVLRAVAGTVTVASGEVRHLRPAGVAGQEADR